MSAKTKNIIKYSVFTILAFLILAGLLKVLSSKETTGGYMNSLTQLSNTPKDTIDVAFVGSSHCFAGIEPCILWDEYGISAFDMSVSGQDKDSAIHCIKELCKTQSPKVVMVDMYALSYDKHGVEGNIYRNYLSLKPSANSIQLVQDFYDNDLKKDLLFRFPIVHTRYRELDMYDFRRYRFNSYARGEEIPVYTHTPAEIVYENYEITEATPLSTKNEKWLLELYELSQKENFELILMVIPFQFESELQMLFNGAKEFADEYGITYINYTDYADEMRLDGMQDFFDATHLNTYGAKKLTSFIGSHTLSDMNLPDHRGDSSYNLWAVDSYMISRYEKIDEFKYNYDIYRYFEILSEINDLYVVVSLEHDYDNPENNYLNMLSPLGIDSNEFKEGGKWVFENGKCQKVCENKEGDFFVKEFKNGDTIRVGYTDEMAEDNFIFNYDPVMPTGYNGTVFIYDTINEEVIDCRGF